MSITTSFNCYRQIEKSIEAELMKDYFDESPYFRQQCRYIDVCTALDNAMDFQGYEAFGSELGICNEKLAWIRKFGSGYANRPSLSATLLDLYMRGACSEPEILVKLQRLSGIFSKIDNHAAKMTVDEEIKDRTSRPSGTSGSSVLQDINGNELTKADKACQVQPIDTHVSQPTVPVSQPVIRKKKKTFRHRIVSKMLGKKATDETSDTGMEPNNNTLLGASNAAYVVEQSMDEKYDTSVQQRNEGQDTGAIHHPVEQNSLIENRVASRKRPDSEISKDSGYTSRSESLAPSETSTVRNFSITSSSTCRPLSTGSTSTIRPLSSVSNSSINFEDHCTKSDRPKSNLESINEEIVETSEKDCKSD